MANIQGFDATKQGPMMDFSAMPVQKNVLAMMTASTMKPTKKADGMYLECEFTIMAEGQYKSRKVWTRLNLSNPNKQAEDIANRELGAICMALGVPKPNDSADLHGKPLLIDIGIETSDQGKAQNKIEKYIAVGSAGVGTLAQPPAPGGAPAPAAPPATPPWMRKA